MMKERTKGMVEEREMETSIKECMKQTAKASMMILSQAETNITIDDAIKHLVSTKPDDYPKGFLRLECWRIPKDEPKWKLLIAPQDVSGDGNAVDHEPAADRPAGNLEK